MRRMMYCGIGLLLLASGCAEPQAPQAGDTVSPNLLANAVWQPGEGANLTVELTATNASGKSRSLGFFTSRSENPVAVVNFFNKDGNAVGSTEKTLSHRC